MYSMIIIQQLKINVNELYNNITISVHGVLISGGFVKMDVSISISIKR